METYGLDSRLLAVASLVRKDKIFADVGTDHGYIPVYLVGNKICEKGFASDINEMPLEKAKMNIKGYGFEDKIETILCDGLEAFQKGGAEDIVIAGMGGDTISHIIGEAKWLKNENIHLILQPMTKTEKLREYLYENGYEIYEEKAVKSGRFVYTVISAGYCGRKEKISTPFYYFGKMYNETDETATEYLVHIVSILKDKAKGQLKSQASIAKAEETLQIVAELEKALDERKEWIIDESQRHI